MPNNNMISTFDTYIQKFFLEAGGNPDEAQQNAAPAEQDAPEGEAADEELNPEDALDDIAPEEPSYPEELELAKLAVRALQFNIQSKDVHNLKFKINGQEIPFERISDYFESTKAIYPIIGFVEWVMDRYEGSASNWMKKHRPGIVSRLKKMKQQLPEDQLLDDNNYLEWTRIVLNSLIKGTPNSNINISEVNEKTIGEVRNALMQSYDSDTRGITPSTSGSSDFIGPATF